MDKPENPIEYDEEDGLFNALPDFAIFRDTPSGHETHRKVLEEDLMDEPLHLQAEAGFAEVSVGGWPLPDDKELGLLRVPQFVAAGGLFWNSYLPPQRVFLLKAMGAATHHARREDIWDYLDAWWPSVKIWLAKWQATINTGKCWQLPGRFGSLGFQLMATGCVIAAPKRTVSYWGSTHPARDEIAPGKRGSAAYVLERMGQRYLDWISAIE